jgi:hypothetical protein
VHVRVDEGRRHPGVLEVDRDVGLQGRPGGVRADPRHDAVLDEQRGGERVGR